MKRAAVRWGVGLLWAALAWPGASAQAADEARVVAPQEVRTWLLSIHEAAQRHNFQGTFVVSSGGVVSSARIAHFRQGSNEFEHSESLNGPTRHVYRHNDVVHTVWPESRLVVVEQRSLVASFPALLQAGNDRIADFYNGRFLTQMERVAGREARMMLIQPKDDWRYGYKLWADQTSGLLLRVDVLGLRGEVLETSAFSDLALYLKPQPESVLRPIQRLASYRTLRPVLTPTRLEEEGWRLLDGAAGFHQVSCVKRLMPEFHALEKSAASPQILQVIYADSLTHVSIFIEPFNAQRHEPSKPQSTSMGATHTLMQRHGDWWLTLMGDVPLVTLQRMAQGLQRTP
jgi:sigma-E factor negative regulatory protein RseB